MEQINQVPLRTLVLRITLRFALILGVILFLTLLLPPLLNLFLPFVLAYFMAALLAPLVGKLTKTSERVWNFWSMFFVLLIILAIVALLVYVGYYLFTQVTDLIASWSSIRDNFIEILRSLSGYLQGHMDMTSTELDSYAQDTLQSLTDWITDKLSSWAPTVMVGVGSVASSVVSFIVSMLFFIIGAYFMTSDYYQIHDKIVHHIPSAIQPHMRHIKAAMDTAMFGYMKAQLVLSGMVTAIIFISLLIWGQDYALIIALITGIVDFLPFFGSGAILVPWSVVDLFLGDYGKALFLIVLALFLFLFRKLAEPKVVGNHTGLSPLVSLMSIYVGMKLGGVIGMILGPVLCMIFISLHGVGFFDPTVEDFKMLFHCILAAATIGQAEDSR